MTQDTKEKILRAARELLNETDDPQRITTREIAKRAGVGIGLINYHFQSQDKLLHTVITDEMTDMALRLQHNGTPESGNPAERLEVMLIALSDYAVCYEKTVRVAITFELLQGKVMTPLFIMPLLMEIFPESDEMKLRLTAFRLITTLQTASLRPEAFADFTGIDLHTEESRGRLVRTLIQMELKAQ